MEKVKLELDFDEITLISSLVARYAETYEMAEILDYIVDDGLEFHDTEDISKRVKEAKAKINNITRKLTGLEETFY